MTGSSMATRCDVTESDVTGNDVTGSDVTGFDVIRPKVGDCPWGVILIVRGVVWYAAADRGIYTTAASADRWICAVVAAAAALLTE